MRVKGHALPLSALQSHQSHIMLPALRSVLPVHFYVLWREDTFKIILLLRVIIAQLHHIPWSITSKPAESRHLFILQMMHCHFNHSTDNLILIKRYFSGAVSYWSFEESICVSADVQQASLLPFEAVRCSEQPAGVYESGSTQRLTSFRLRSEPQGRLPGPVPPVGYTHVLKHSEWGGEIDNLIHLKKKNSLDKWGGGGE